MDSLPTLAEAAPETTLNILRLHLLEGTVLQHARGFVRADSDEFMQVFKILYTKSPEKTRELINELLPVNSGQFWGLKDVLK